MAEETSLAERWGVIGHDWAVEVLERAISAGRAVHAFLITGLHGSGKTTLARALARRLECLERDAPCGQCRACIKIAKGIHPDVRLIEGVPTRWKYEEQGPPPSRMQEGEKRTLVVEQIRDLERWLATAPFESQYKIAIVRRFEEANEAAANAFLKTLEEPPRHAFLLLTAQEAGLVLPTIVSRCQVIALRPLAVKIVERALVEKWGVKADEARLLARLSGGRLGWAVKAVQAPQLLERRRAALEALHALMREGRAERLIRAGKLAEEASELPEVLETWLTWWRDLLLLRGGDDGRVMNVDYYDALVAQVNRLPLAALAGALTATRTALRQLQQNANARLVTEVLALDLPYL